MKCNTLDELWAEYEKAIELGDFGMFKTREEMTTYLKNQYGGIDAHSGHLYFYFMPSPGEIIKLTIDVKDIK